MFCALHNRGQGKVAEIIRKWYFQSSLLFLLSILGLQFSGKGKRLRKTEDEYSQGRPCQGFHVYITKQLDLLLPFFFCQRREFPSHLWSPEATSIFSYRNETEILCRSNSIKFSNQVARILISVIIRKQLSTASVPHVR